MTLRPPCRAWIAAGAAAALLSACDEVSHPPPGLAEQRTPQQRIALVNRTLGGRDGEAQLLLQTPCSLIVQWSSRDPDEYPVMVMETALDTDRETSEYLVFLRRRDVPQPAALLMATPDWQKMTLVRSELSQLRADCVAWEQKRSPRVITAAAQAGPERA